jgi:hypothetical protein
VLPVIPYSQDDPDTDQYADEDGNVHGAHSEEVTTSRNKSASDLLVGHRRDPLHLRGLHRR